MRWVAQNRRERLNVCKAHSLPNASMVLETNCRDKRGRDRQHGSDIHTTQRNTVMLMQMMRLMARLLKEMLQIMRDKVQPHKQEENAHGEPSQDFSTFQTEWVADT